MTQERPIRTLYIRDDPKTALRVTERLVRHGFAVESPESGAAVAAVRNRKAYDVLCVDLTRPGASAVGHLREYAGMGEPSPTIIITGPETAAVVAEFMGRGPICSIVADADGRYLDTLPCLIERLFAYETLDREKQRVEKVLGETEQRLRWFSEAAFEGIFFYDGDVILDANQAFASMGGYDLSEIIGSDPMKLIAPENREEAAEKARAGYGGPSEYTAFRKDGSTIPIEVYSKSFQMEGRTVRAIAVRDITKRRAMEARLRESEDLIKAVFDCSGVALGMTDRDGRWVQTNTAFTRMLGYTPGDLAGLTNLDITHPDDRQRTAVYIDDMVEGRIDSHRTEKRYLHKDGSVVWADVSLTAIRDTRKGLTAIVGAIMDVTDKKRIEERLFMSQKMEAIGTLAGGIAHDFNNILATVLGYSSFLKGKASPDDIFFQGLEAIEQSAVRASELTSQIMAYSRGGKMEIETVSMNRVIREIHNLIRKTFDKSIDIRLDLDEDIATVSADISQMKQMVLNLAINARDVMPDGGTLTIRTLMLTIPDERIKAGGDIRAGRYVGLSVSDTGAGMDRESKQRIFEPYFSKGESQWGAGLGLSVVYGVARRHGGWVDVKSEVGVGTEFVIGLPESEKTVDAQAPELKEVRGGTETILIVDDETHIVQMLTRLLTDFGYRVLQSETGADGVRIFEEQGAGIDLVLLDIMMPGMGGKEVMGRILGLRPDAKILLASGYSEQERHRDLMEMGAVGFIGKPFVLHDLLRKIRDILD
jgi:two-component system cell cycle sensor histidine kinase/response regulator CckA